MLGSAGMLTGWLVCWSLQGAAIGSLQSVRTLHIPELQSII